jgi:hypothetical protein
MEKLPGVVALYLDPPDKILAKVSRCRAILGL